MFFFLYSLILTNYEGNMVKLFQVLLIERKLKVFLICSVLLFLKLSKHICGKNALKMSQTALYT